jgi:putative endonuclease
MIKNQYGNLYIGVTDNTVRRLAEHNSKRGSNFTKVRDVFEIVFLEHHVNLTSARKREIQIKKWRRGKKDFLIERYKNKLQTR